MRGTPEERFWAKVKKTDTCWLWTAAANREGGYGVFRPDKSGGLVYVHRWIWEKEVGPIPVGMTVNHLCRSTICVRVEHMEVVTQAQNNDYRYAVPTCKRNHPWSEENTGRRKDNGTRYCLTCRREYVRAREWSQRAIHRI